MKIATRLVGPLAMVALLAVVATIGRSNEKPTTSTVKVKAPSSTAAPFTDADPAVARARKTVQMLDDIYKNAVVLITDKYVHEEDDFPAGSAAVALFEAISKKGWHQVRLIDATGQPYEEKNVASDDFEKAGIARLKAGDAVYEQVVEVDGQRQFRALTPVPVVMKKCVMCHAHYADAKENEPIGAISYSVPVE